MNPAGYSEQIRTLRESFKNLQAALAKDEFFAHQARRIRIRNAIAQRLDDALDLLREVDNELANLLENPADTVNYDRGHKT